MVFLCLVYVLFPYPYVVSVFLIFWACSAWLDFVFFAPFLPCFGAFADHFPVWVFVIFPGFWWGFWCWVDDGAAACWSVVVFVAVVLVGVVVVVPPEDFGAVHACWLYCVVFMFGHCVVILHWNWRRLLRVWSLILLCRGIRRRLYRGLPMCWGLGWGGWKGVCWLRRFWILRLRLRYRRCRIRCFLFARF